jgi:fucose permease
MHTYTQPSRRLFILFLAGFATFGTIFTIIGAALPHVIRAFHWSYAVTGAVLAASAVGYFVSSFLSGFLMQRFSPKAILISGLVIGAACMAFFVRWPSPWLNLCLNVGIGICQGAIEVVINLEVIHMERQGQSRLMNMVHAAFCLGGIVGPAAVGFLLGIGSGGLAVFMTTAGVLLSMAVLFALTPFPRLDQHAGGGAHGAGLLRQPLLLILTLFLLLYVGAELGVSNWISEYFVKVLSSTASTGAFIVSFFWVGLFAGRLALSFAYKGSRQELIMLGLSLLSAASLGVVLTVHTPVAVAVGVFLTGLGFSGLYPLSMTVVGRSFKSGIAVGTAATGGGIGSFTFPFLMAVLAEAFGVQGGFFFYLGLTLALVVLSLVLIGMAKRHAVAETAPTGRHP